MTPPIAVEIAKPSVASSARTLLWGYPKGVFLLSFTELWERFSYYGILALLVLFLTTAVEAGGFGWERSEALRLYGWYTGLIFSAPVLGGWIANEYWGERRCVLLGGILLAAGHACLSGPALLPWLAAHLFGQEVPRAATTGSFYLGLLLVVLGTALLKPTISSLVGRMFAADDARRDGAFAVFFVGIYIGSLAASLCVGYLGERIGWHVGFSAAGLGMALGLAVYIGRQAEYLGDIGKAPVGRRSAEASRTLTSVERARILVLMTQGMFTVVYAAAFYQKGGLLTLFARERLDRGWGSWEIPVTWFLMVSTATFIVTVPLLARVWQHCEARQRNPAAATKLACGLMLLGCGYAIICVATAVAEANGVKPAAAWLIVTYVCFGVADALVWPTQIALVTRLAPPHLSAALVGGWYITIGLGSWLTGYIGALGYSWGMTPLFAALAVATVALGCLLWSLTPRLHRLGQGIA